MDGLAIHVDDARFEPDGRAPFDGGRARRQEQDVLLTGLGEAGGRGAAGAEQREGRAGDALDQQPTTHSDLLIVERWWPACSGGLPARPRATYNRRGASRRTHALLT